MIFKNSVESLRATIHDETTRSWNSSGKKSLNDEQLSGYLRQQKPNVEQEEKVCRTSRKACYNYNGITLLTLHSMVLEERLRWIVKPSI